MSWGASAYGYHALGDAGEDGPTFAGLMALSDVTTSSVTLAWDAASDVDEGGGPLDALVYEVHGATTAGAPFVVRAVTAPGVTSATVTDLKSGVVYHFRVRVRDAHGHVSLNDEELAVTTLVGAPVVSNLSPAPGSVIAPGDSLSFDVTDDSGVFTRIFLTVAFAATGAVESIHDGDGFAPLYGATSTRTSIVGGFHYVVRRYGGWPSAPTFKVYPIDATGNEG